MTMSDGKASDGDGHGAGAAGAEVDGEAAGAPALAVDVGEAGTPTAPLEGVGEGAAGDGDADVVGHGDPGGRHGSSGVGSIPLAHGAPAGPTTRPLTVGALNLATGMGTTADFMNFCQIVAGRVPPETWMPCTLVIAGVWPDFGSVG